MPVDREALRNRLRLLFLDELDDHVRTLNQGLMTLEQGPPAAEAEAVVHELFRAAHSLKGAARSAGIEPLGNLLHWLEETLTRLRDRSLTPTPAALSTLFAAADAIAAAGRRMRDGDDSPGGDLQAACRGLVGLAGAEPAPSATGAPPEARSDFPVRDSPAPGSPAPAGVASPVDPEPQRRVRVSVARLDGLLNEVGEVLLAARRVEALAGKLAELSDAVAPGRRPERPDGPDGQDPLGLHERIVGAARSAADTSRRLSTLSGALADSVRRIRMLPLADGLDGLGRMVRDLTTAENKDVRFAVEGGDLEVERPILEAARVAVLHLVRNAVDHGIEVPGERAAGGKPRAGTITVSATLEGEGVTIAVADDGRGFDPAAIRSAAERARRGGLLDTGDDADIIELAFAPGVSTAPTVTEVSGRGVGLDAVRSRVEGAGGTVRVDSEPGRGSRVVLALPLALSTVRVLFVSVAGETVALPSGGVSRLLRAAPEALRAVGARNLLLVDQRSVPVVPLAGALGVPVGDEPPPERFAGVVVGTGDDEAVLAVDALLGEQEVVMKPIAGGRTAIPGILGATILETGRVAVVLNPATCVRAGLSRTSPSVPPTDRRRARTHPRVLLAEDSLTSRVLERSILEAAGHEVVVAVDGAEAWRLLQDHDVDVVVTDVDMPRMDGFALCDAIKRSGRFRHLPVILVTSLGGDADRRRGADVGADAYIVKGDFEQAVLLDAVERLL